MRATECCYGRNGRGEQRIAATAVTTAARAYRQTKYAHTHTRAGTENECTSSHRRSVVVNVASRHVLNTITKECRRALVIFFCRSRRRWRVDVAFGNVTRDIISHTYTHTYTQFEYFEYTRTDVSIHPILPHTHRYIEIRDRSRARAIFTWVAVGGWCW